MSWTCGSREEDQRDEDVNGTLLGKPEAQLVTAKANVVQRLDENDPEQVRDNEPDHHADSDQPEVRLPVVAVAGHSLPLLLVIASRADSDTECRRAGHRQRCHEFFPHHSRDRIRV